MQITPFWMEFSKITNIKGLHKTLKHNSIYFIDSANIEELLSKKDLIKDCFFILFCDKDNIIPLQLKYQHFVDGFFITGTENILLKSKMLEMLFNNKSLSELFINSFKTNISVSTEKEKKLNQLENSIKTLRINKRLLDLVLNTFDELLMNGIYDAPIDTSGFHCYKNINRNTMMVLEKPLNIEIVLEPNFLIFSIIDHYGSFNFETLTTIMQKNNQALLYEPIDDNISKGAGLGLTLSFNKGTSFLLQGSKLSETKITAFFPIYNDFKDFKNHEKFLINNLWKKIT